MSVTLQVQPLTLLCESQSHPRRKSRNPRKPSYGTSRRSVLKKSFTQEQVVFTAPVSDDPVVAVIGGGISGLICALTLEQRGLRSTVFDAGIHGFGGRMGTRIIDPHSLKFDHAAQFFAVSDPHFGKLVDGWLKNGLVQQWKGTIGELEAGGQFAPFTSSVPKYIGVNGMRSLADSILSQTSMVTVERPCWIDKLEPFNGMWHLSENGKPRGHFDAIVIAHNGKCANRLLSSSGLPAVAKQMKKLDLSSIWALLAAFEDPLPLPGNAVAFEGAFVKGIDSLSWMGNNTNKLSYFQSAGPHCWTFLSTAAFGKQNKVPQESIPNATAERVKTSMLAGVEIALGLSKGSLKQPLYTWVQLWGAALPTNTPDVSCIFDPHGRVGVCGDWLLGSSMEAAALSGMALANHDVQDMNVDPTRRDIQQNGGTSEGEKRWSLIICGQFSSLNKRGIFSNRPTSLSLQTSTLHNHPGTKVAELAHEGEGTSRCSSWKGAPRPSPFFYLHSFTFSLYFKKEKEIVRSII